MLGVKRQYSGSAIRRYGSRRGATGSSTTPGMAGGCGVPEGVAFRTKAMVSIGPSPAMQPLPGSTALDTVYGNADLPVAGGTRAGVIARTWEPLSVVGAGGGAGWPRRSSPPSAGDGSKGLTPLRCQYTSDHWLLVRSRLLRTGSYRWRNWRSWPAPDHHAFLDSTRCACAVGPDLPHAGPCLSVTRLRRNPVTMVKGGYVPVIPLTVPEVRRRHAARQSYADHLVRLETGATRPRSHYRRRRSLGPMRDCPVILAMIQPI